MVFSILVFCFDSQDLIDPECPVLENGLKVFPISWSHVPDLVAESLMWADHEAGDAVVGAAVGDLNEN